MFVATVKGCAETLSTQPLQRVIMAEGPLKGIGKEGPQHACRILITCTEPTGDGKMDVEMTYEGDPTLASYLLERAQAYVEQEDDGLNFC
jgi:hypothetical protein